MHPIICKSHKDVQQRHFAHALKRYKGNTFLSGIKTKRPTKHTTKRKAVIQPNPGSLIAFGLLPSFSTPDNS